LARDLQKFHGTFGTHILQPKISAEFYSFASSILPPSFSDIRHRLLIAILGV
jgi:hypothetical protein